MSGNVTPRELGHALRGLRPHEDARAIVRLLQCAHCSYILKEPVILPCGNSICRRCVPSTHTREHISYPRNPDRAEGFKCPSTGCGIEHSVADCNLDITLNKLIEVIRGQILLNSSNTVQARIQLDERLHMQNLRNTNIDIMPRSRVLNGGRIVAAFNMADAGELDYHSELAFTPISAADEENVKAMDEAIANDLRAVCRTELECHVCYGLMVDPLTGNCGHTFCRRCIARVLDHSTICPACRRPMMLRPGVIAEPSNQSLKAIIGGLLAQDLQERTTTIRIEEGVPEQDWLALFPCTLAFPGMPTFLHIFEPRYRLMIRRCLDNGTRTFGILMYNARGYSQGSLGSSEYLQYGTALYVQRVQLFGDGRSLLECVGMYRFRVLEGSMLDGYHIGRVERVEDQPLAEEEALESAETSGPNPAEDDFEGRIRHMSTQALLQYCMNFVETGRSRSAEWLHERVLSAYGPPPLDPASFPFWFASVLPINEQQKYTLLPLTSVRERLKLTARWVKVLDEATR